MHQKQTHLQEFSKRLRKLVDHLGFRSVNEFSQALGYSSPEKINRLLRSNTNKPSADILFDIAKKFAVVNMRWLITGDGIWNDQGSNQSKKYTNQETEKGSILGPNSGSNDQNDHQLAIASEDSNADYKAFKQRSNNDPDMIDVFRLITRMQSDLLKIQEDMATLKEDKGEA